LAGICRDRSPPTARACSVISAESLAIGQTIGPGTELGYQPTNASAEGAGAHCYGFTFLNDGTGAYDYGYIAIGSPSPRSMMGA